MTRQFPIIPSALFVLSVSVNSPGVAQERVIGVPGVGHEGQGAGIAIANLDGNPRPELILMAYDAPAGPNEFRYKIGWNLSPHGVAASWSGIVQVPGVGHEAQGAGVAVASLDRNPRPDLILMAYDNPPGANEFRYKIGWNLDRAGLAASWSGIIQIAGVGHEAQGAGIAVGNLDDDSRPEFILMGYDNPPEGNEFRYKIGWNVGAAGVATKWGEMVHAAGVGWEAQGAGLALANLDENARPELILLAYDNPWDPNDPFRGPMANDFRYKIGWNVSSSGVVARWSGFAEVSGVGWDGQGADITVADLNGDGRADPVVMAYDNPQGPNEFRYRVLLSVPPSRSTASIHGFADTHAHQLANLGFGGMAFWGAPFAAGGMKDALPKCDFTTINGVPVTVHSPGGAGDLIGSWLDGQLGHWVHGYPKFDGWPRHNSHTHQQMYHTWLHRAYLGGLRLMVMHAVNSEPLCRVANNRLTCNDMEAVDRQLQAARELERFIDERSGGPGMGWYRIVRSGREARDVINSGKLAVVLGIEVDNLFNCGATGACTEQTVRDAVRRYYDLGVRHIFPIHLADNAFGGSAVYQDFFNINNFLLTGRFFEVYDCSATGVEFRFGDLSTVPRFLLAAAAGRAPPLYPLGAHCNVRGLTVLGEFLLREAMRLGMIIDVDHMSRRALDRALDIAAEQRYPVIAGHTGFHDVKLGQKRAESEKTRDHLRRIRDVGGMVSVVLVQGTTQEIAAWGKRVPDDCSLSSKSWAQAYLYAVDQMGGAEPAAVGLGSDFNGLAGWPGPRFEPEGCGKNAAEVGVQRNRIVYPFTSYTGAPPMGQSWVANKVFDYNVDGLAHVGLLPDFIQDLRNVGLTERDLAPLFRSAEGYVAMWERIDARRAAGAGGGGSQR